jgi:very-short-patch-repair endonuclease
MKFGGYEDYRGSGHFSGRLTVALVAAGVVAKKLLTSPQTPLQGRGALTSPGKFGYVTNSLDQWQFLSEFANENRKNSTEAEEKLWQALRNRKVNDCKFRRQHAVAGYIPDFVCLEKKLIIEVDGGYHNAAEQAQFDKVRTAWLEENNYRVIRFTNDEVIQSLPLVLDEISKHLSLDPVSSKKRQSDDPISPSPLERESEGEVIAITATILEIGGETDLDKGLQKAIDNKDSIGGIIECRATGLPTGLGEPFFDSAESILSHIVFAIPAVRGMVRNRFCSSKNVWQPAQRCH